MIKIRIDPGVFIILAILILLVPLPWIIAWVTAVCFHEYCHFAIVRLCGGHIEKLEMGLGGANMECADLADGSYILSVLAGPVGGFLLVLFGRWLPKLAICSWLLSAYNLLPVLPLDGGRILRMLIKNDKLFVMIERTFLFSVTVLALYGYCAAGLGLLPLTIVAILWIKNRKRPCKGTFCGVQ